MNGEKALALFKVVEREGRLFVIRGKAVYGPYEMTQEGLANLCEKIRWNLEIQFNFRSLHSR